MFSMYYTICTAGVLPAVSSYCKIIPALLNICSYKVKKNMLERALKISILLLIPSFFLDHSTVVHHDNQIKDTQAMVLSNLSLFFYQIYAAFENSSIITSFDDHRSFMIPQELIRKLYRLFLDWHALQSNPDDIPEFFTKT
jgi:hypothetical protein